MFSEDSDLRTPSANFFLPLKPGCFHGSHAPKRTVSNNICAHFLHMSYRCVREMLLICSSVCFLIGIAAYFGFMRTVLHCTDQSLYVNISAHARTQVLGSEGICNVHVCKKTCMKVIKL